jgi:hypothetical protein
MNRVKKQLSLFGVVATLALVFAGVAQAGTLNLSVDVNEGSFIGPAAGAGPFTVEGNTGSGEGTFQCWGWFNLEGEALVSQVFFILGRGSITTQGIEGGLLAVTGGTGDFSNVRGEALQTFTGEGFDFDMVFTLRGARGD